MKSIVEMKQFIYEKFATNIGKFVGKTLNF